MDPDLAGFENLRGLLDLIYPVSMKTRVAVFFYTNNKYAGQHKFFPKISILHIMTRSTANSSNNETAV
jgi:hypothetical protein